jgi:hypothetical protein
VKECSAEGCTVHSLHSAVMSLEAARRYHTRSERMMTLSILDFAVVRA